MSHSLRGLAAALALILLSGGAWSGTSIAQAHASHDECGNWQARSQAHLDHRAAQFETADGARHLDHELSTAVAPSCGAPLLARLSTPPLTLPLSSLDVFLHLDQSRHSLPPRGPPLS